MTRDLLELLHARVGIVCLVGAGGKKSVLYRIAAAHPGRVAITATAHIERFPDQLHAHTLVAAEAELAARLAASQDARVVAFAQPSAKSGRNAGLSGATVARLHRSLRFDLTLVKADGARGRLVKAPNDAEPPLADETTTVIPVVSAKAIGRSADETVVHRLERFCAVTGAAAGAPITPEHIARLLSHASGALKNVSQATVVPVINMVDGEAERTLAEEAARQALRMTERFDYVVLAAMQAAAPIVEVVNR
jgi:probable selenium-dependent hydroxylase accessory protein YqeC